MNFLVPFTSSRSQEIGLVLVDFLRLELRICIATALYWFAGSHEPEMRNSWYGILWTWLKCIMDMDGYDLGKRR